MLGSSWHLLFDFFLFTAHNETTKDDSIISKILLINISLYTLSLFSVQVHLLVS